MSQITKDQEMQIDTISNFLSAHPGDIVRSGLKRYNQMVRGDKSTPTAAEWKIWTEDSPPGPPYEWHKIADVIYYREPLNAKPPQPVPAASASGCQSCGDKKKGNISKGLVGLAKAQFGIGRSTDKLIAERKAICMSCPANDIGRCDKCGCYLHAKIRIRKETCPIRRW